MACGGGWLGHPENPVSQILLLWWLFVRNVFLWILIGNGSNYKLHQNGWHVILEVLCNGSSLWGHIPLFSILCLRIISSIVYQTWQLTSIGMWWICDLNHESCKLTRLKNKARLVTLDLNWTNNFWDPVGAVTLVLK